MLKKLLCAVVLLTGCTPGGFIGEDVAVALYGQHSREQLLQMAESNPYTSTLISFNGNPPAYVVLAYADPLKSLGYSDSSSEHSVLKWVTGDRYMISTYRGRIVSSLQLPTQNLTSVTNLSNDPLVMGLLDDANPLSWQFEISWQPNNHESYAARSYFVREDEEVLSLFQGEVNTVRFAEYVTVDTVEQSYVNYYWVDANRGTVLKTKQLLTPLGPLVEIELARPWQGGL